MPNHLPGGRRHDNMRSMMRHGSPNLQKPDGAHGTVQLPIMNDPEDIKTAIRRKFSHEGRAPGFNLSEDIHFIAIDNGDGTMEVNFESRNGD